MANTPDPGEDFERRLNDSTGTVAEFEYAPRGFIGTVQHVLHANPTYVPVIVLVASIAVFGAIAGERFFSPFNLTLIMQQVSIIGILAAAQSPDHHHRGDRPVGRGHHGADQRDHRQAVGGTGRAHADRRCWSASCVGYGGRLS